MNFWELSVRLADIDLNDLKGGYVNNNSFDHKFIEKKFSHHNYMYVSIESCHCD